MKKFFALVLALVMALSLVACGDKKDDSGDVTAEHTDTTTVAVGAVILARDDVSSDDVYKFVADIFDNAASLTTSHAKYGELSLEYGASITSVPYHPGAAKYFAEKGFEVAAVKDGAGNTDSRNLRFVTGGESGTYYAFGSVIAQHATNNAGINVVGLVGNGSQANVQELVDGTADFAFCQSDVMAYAYNGTNLFDTKVEGFSTVAALYMEQVQIVTTNASIKTVADLAGKSVSIGAPGSTAVLAMLNDAVKKGGVMASNHVGGLSGAFIPVSEDIGMIEAASAGALTLEKLEAMTCVCSVGLDMIAIPGDTSAAAISGIIADEAAIGMVNNKTTAVRVIPAVGKKAGDTVEFGGLLGFAPVMPVNPYGNEEFVARGGRIPAPLHSLRN